MRIQNWYAPLIVTTLFFIFFFTFFTPIYETNDDVFFTLIANGYYTKTPTPFFQMNSGLQTIHISIGYLLVFLYKVFPQLNWFSIILYALAFIGLYALLVPIFYRVKNRLFLVISVSLLLLFVCRLFIFLSFTTIAAIGSAGGFFLFLFLIQTNRQFSFYFIITIFLLIISQLVRQSSFFMIFILSLPLLFQVAVLNKKKIVTISLWVIFILFSILIVRHTNISAYKQVPKWNKATTFMYPLATFLYGPETYKYSNNEDMYKSIGWSENDYNMLANFFYDDADIFSAKKLHTLVNTVQSSGVNVQGLKRLPLYFLIIIIAVFEYLFLFILLLVLSWNSLKSCDKKSMLATATLVIIFTLYFLYRGYLPQRVMLSMLFFVSYLSVFLTSEVTEYPRKQHAHRKFVFYIFILAFIVVHSMKLFELQIANKERIKIFRQIISILPKKDALTFIWGSSFPYQWQYVFSTNSEFKDIHILIGAWQQRSPLNDAIKKKFHIRNLYKSLSENGKLYLIAIPYQKELLRIFFQEHYHNDIEFETVISFNEYKVPSELLKVKIIRKRS